MEDKKKEKLPPGMYRDKDGVLTLTGDAVKDNKDNQAFPEKQNEPNRGN